MQPVQGEINYLFALSTQNKDSRLGNPSVSSPEINNRTTFDGQLPFRWRPPSEMEKEFWKRHQSNQRPIEVTFICFFSGVSHSTNAI